VATKFLLRCAPPVPKETKKKPEDELSEWSNEIMKTEKDFKKLKAAAMSFIKKTGAQNTAMHAEAVEIYKKEQETFDARHPELVKDLEKVNAAAHAVGRADVVSFYMGFVEGLANTKLDPEQLAQKIAVDMVTDNLELSAFMEQCKIHDSSLEPAAVEKDVKRLESFMAALLTLIKGISTTIEDLSKEYAECAGVLILVQHIIKMASPPYLALIKQLVIDAFHFASKKHRENDLAAIHFLVSAWDVHPKTYKTWHQIGHSLGVVCLATVGD